MFGRHVTAEPHFAAAMRTALIYAKGETMLLRQPLQYAFADAAHQTDAQLHLNIRYAHVRFSSEEPSGRNHAIGQDATTEQEILYTGARRSKKVDMFIGGNWFRDSELHPVRDVVLQIGSDFRRIRSDGNAMAF